MDVNWTRAAWPIVAGLTLAILAGGAMTSVVAENTRTNHKQDTAIEGIVEIQRQQAATNGKLEARTESTGKAVEQILKLLLEEARENGRR